MVMVGYGHKSEEAVIYIVYFKIICAMGVERRDKGIVLFHITNFVEFQFLMLRAKYKIIGLLVLEKIFKSINILFFYPFPASLAFQILTISPFKSMGDLC